MPRRKVVNQMKEKWSKLLVPAYVFLMIAIIIIVIVSAIKKSKINNKETEEEIISTESETEISTTEMFTATNLCIRKGPGTEFEIHTTIPLNTKLKIVNGLDGGWSQIIFEDNTYYVCSEYLSYERVDIYEPYDLKYYGIWNGAYWHFTPEEIDNQWNGTKSFKPLLEQGTTRAWQKYLYEKLSEKHCEWFYKYAVAQAMQESGMNPLNNIGHTQISWLNGEATYDCGLYNFKEKYWDSAKYGDIFDYHSNINAYVDRIYPYLTGVTTDSDFYFAISQHYNGDGGINMAYVNAVLSRVNELWEQ